MNRDVGERRGVAVGERVDNLARRAKVPRESVVAAERKVVDVDALEARERVDDREQDVVPHAFVLTLLTACGRDATRGRPARGVAHLVEPVLDQANVLLVRALAQPRELGAHLVRLALGEAFVQALLLARVLEPVESQARRTLAKRPLGVVLRQEDALVAVAVRDVVIDVVLEVAHPEPELPDVTRMPREHVEQAPARAVVRAPFKVERAPEERLCERAKVARDEHQVAQVCARARVVQL